MQKPTKMLRNSKLMISCVLQVGLLKLTRKGLIDVHVRDWLVREDKLHCSIKTCMWFVWRSDSWWI